MRRVLLAFVGATVVAATVVGYALRQDSDARDAGALLDDVVAAGAPGALLVTRMNGSAETEARGLARLQPATPMRPNARFRIGSITKTFVAALVLKLAEDGKLELDDTVERWLPRAIAGGRRITIRQLLSHTSGLPDYVEDSRVVRDLDRRWTPEELVALADGQPRSRRGRFAYASTNYVLLGLVAERAGGAPLARQLTNRIFQPLGLRRTTFAPGILSGGFVRGHRPPSHQGVVTGPPREVEPSSVWWSGAAGGIVSTAEDVQRFYAALLGGRLLPPASLRQMEELIPAGRNQYGLGIAVFPTPCGPAWGHTGNVGGVVVVAWNTPDARRQLVLVVNAFPLSPDLEAAVRRAQDASFCTV
jgi:D-alanyl-D-alanine carboxypeptidase